MTTLNVADFRLLAVTRQSMVRINRVFAWSLLISPIVQLVMHVALKIGITIELLILIPHAVLSLALFGPPRTKLRRFSMSMHVAGFRCKEMTDRNRFLLSGYRIALAMAASVLIVSPFHIAAVLIDIALAYPLLRMSFSVAEHVFGASVYALRRWHQQRFARYWAYAITAAYLLLSFINTVR